jgi:hypothetical protein
VKRRPILRKKRKLEENVLKVKAYRVQYTPRVKQNKNRRIRTNQTTDQNKEENLKMATKSRLKNFPSQPAPPHKNYGYGTTAASITIPKYIWILIIYCQRSSQSFKKNLLFNKFGFLSMPRGPSVTYKPTWERANLNTASRLSIIHFLHNITVSFNFQQCNFSKWFGKIKLYVVIAGIIPYVLYFEILFCHNKLKIF